MALTGNKIFTLKTYGAQLYKWEPIPADKKRTGREGKRPTFCTATPGSQGEDWNCNYVYDLTVINGQQHRFAYVECDYVQ